MPAPKRQQKADRTGPPNNPGLGKLIEAKQRRHRPERTLPLPREGGVPRPGSSASPGSNPFLGWHERGYLPHFDGPNVTQFLTFTLHDAFPVTRRREWESALHEASDSARRRKLEAWLDRSHGNCWLQREEIASLVETKLRENDGEHYRLHAWVIMPNHVHLVVDVWQTPLSKLLFSWKGASARGANLSLNRSGAFWEREYFDTIIRDAAHLKQAIKYTEGNPVKAGLVRDRKAWPWSSARFRDDYERMPFEQPLPPEG